MKYIEKIPKNYQYQTKANKEKFMEGWKAKYSLKQGLEMYKESLN